MDHFESLCLMDFEPTGHSKRPVCKDCLRPVVACWCSCLPESRLPIRTNILILQHPYEESRKIRTARILELALAENRCRIVRGRKFNEQQCPDLIPILTGEDTYVLFPYHGAVPASECRPDYDDSSHRSRWLIVLDGTWTQARHMLTGSPLLFALKRVCLPPNPLTGEFDRSQFVRRQPFSEAVCTVEAVSRILDLWEPPDSSRPTDFYQSRLLRPLHRILEVNLKCIRKCIRKTCDNTVPTCS